MKRMQPGTEAGKARWHLALLCGCPRIKYQAPVANGKIGSGRLWFVRLSLGLLFMVVSLVACTGRAPQPRVVPRLQQPTAAPTPAGISGRVVVPRLGLKTRATDRSPTTGFIDEGETVLIDGRDGGCHWLHVHSPDGTSGWVHIEDIHVERLTCRQDLEFMDDDPRTGTSPPQPPQPTVEPPPIILSRLEALADQVWRWVVVAGALVLVLAAILFLLRWRRDTTALPAAVPDAALAPSTRAGAAPAPNVAAMVSPQTDNTHLEAKHCLHCGASTRPQAKICSKCGRQLLPVHVAAPSPAPTGVITRPAGLPSPQRPASALTLQAASLTDLGLVRTINEDSFLALTIDQSHNSLNTSTRLYAVADGMGGHTAGEIASRLVINALSSHLTANIQQPVPGVAAGRPDYVHLLEQACLHAAREVYDYARQIGADMGSTLVAALVDLEGGKVYAANIGDSRLYKINQTRLTQITRDHSMVQLLVEKQRLTVEQARSHPQANLIYRTLGEKPAVEVDIFTQTIVPGDYLILCSDGLSGKVEDAQIQQIVLDHPAPQAACQELVQRAKAAGGDDNITVIVILVESTLAQAAA